MSTMKLKASMIKNRKRVEYFPENKCSEITIDYDRFAEDMRKLIGLNDSPAHESVTTRYDSEKEFGSW